LISIGGLFYEYMKAAGTGQWTRRLRITSRNAEYFLLQEWCSVKEMASSCSLGGGFKSHSRARIQGLLNRGGCALSHVWLVSPGSLVTSKLKV
jgi:hypothetical protein